MNPAILGSLLAASAAAALLALRRSREAEQRLEMLRAAHARLSESHHDEMARLQDELKAAEQALRLARGEGRFHAAMTVGEALAADPRAGQVLAAFHIGGCNSCAAESDDTLRYAAGSGGQDVEKLVAALNALDGEGADALLTSLERRPNVQITL